MSGKEEVKETSYQSNEDVEESGTRAEQEMRTDSHPIFLARMQTALQEDLDEELRSQCVGLGFDRNIVGAMENGQCSGNASANCVFFLPELGYDATRGDRRECLNRMVSLFLKVSRSVVHDRYSVVYGHTKHFAYFQANLLRQFLKILPHCYRKNLSRIYVVHPTTGLRAFFRMSSIFLRDKVVDKVIFLQSISQLQEIVSPLAVRLPPNFILLEDRTIRRTVPFMFPLAELFEEQYESPRFVAECLRYLRKYGLQREGLFRVPGDQIILNLSELRFRDKSCSRIILGDHDSFFHHETLQDSDKVLTDFEGLEKKQSHRDYGDNRCASVVVDDVDEVAQLFKAYLRSLPDAVITHEAYVSVVNCIHDINASRNSEATSKKLGSESPEVHEELDLGSAIEFDLEKSLPPSHWKTLNLILSFLADIAIEAQVNKMSPDNISVVFAPTLIRIDMSSPATAVESLSISQRIVRVLLMRRMEKSMAERLSSKISLSRFG